MARRWGLAAFQELGRQGEGLRLGAQGGQAAAAAEEDVPQGQGGAVPLPPEQQQKLHGAGGHRRGHEGLEAQLPDAEVGGEDLRRQGLGEGVVVVDNGVGQDQALAVGAEAAAFRQEGGVAGVALGKVRRPGVHHAETQAPDLLGEEALMIQVSGLIPVGGKVRRPAEGVHRVAHHQEEAPEPSLPGQAGIVLRQGTVSGQLGHAHVAPRSHRRDGLGGGKEEDIAVEEMVQVHGLHLQEGAVVPGPGDLAHLGAPARHGGLVDVADADAVDDIAAQELQGREKGAAHVSHRQEVEALLSPGEGLEAEGVLPAGMGQVHGLESPVLDALQEGLGQVRDLSQGIRGKEADVLRLREELPGVRGAEDGPAPAPAQEEALRAVRPQGEAGQG